jgi:GNAT superfamily N-acetyltransferase
MHLRTARQDDAPRIAALHAASWRIAYLGILSDAYLNGNIVAERTAVWAHRLSTPEPGQHVLVAEEDEALAGFACALGAYDLRWGTRLDNLHVAQTFQRKGVGARLLSSVAEWSSTHWPDQGVWCWVLRPNVAARRFYELLGGVESGEGVWNSPDGRTIPRVRYSWSAASQLLPQPEGPPEALCGKR